MRLSAVTAFFFFSALLVAAPASDEILEKARKALGDVGSMKSLSVSGVRRVSVETPDGPGSMTRTSEAHFLLPDKFLRSETIEMPSGMEGPTIVEGLDGAASWRDTQNAPSGGHNIIIRAMPPGGGPAEGPAADEARTRALRSIYLRNLLLYTLTPPAGTDVKFEYKGEAEGPDGKAWIIDATGPDRFALRLFVDQKSNLPVMASWRGFQTAPVVRMMTGPPSDGDGPPPHIDPPKPKEVEYQMRLSDHAKQGGLLLPKLMTISVEGKLTEEFELKSAKFNPNLKPEKFRK